MIVALASKNLEVIINNCRNEVTFSNASFKKKLNRNALIFYDLG
jgi:hypothetical protein